MLSKHYEELSCAQCAGGLEFDFTFAFQPIVNTEDKTIFSYEALVRGLKGESAFHVLSQLNDDNRYRFDQVIRVKAIMLAKKLGVTSNLNINFMPNAVYRPELCIRTTLDAAETCGFPVQRIIFEATEEEVIDDHRHFAGIVGEYKRMGFQTAIDDFGAGHAGLSLLTEFVPDLIKLDMKLIRGIDLDRVRQSILRGIVQVARDLSIGVIAEGVETREEYEWLSHEGVALFQGFYFAKPGFEHLPEVNF